MPTDLVMKSTLLLAVGLAALASRQEPPAETAEDLDKRARTSLQVKAAVVKGLTLAILFFMHRDIDVEVYVDPVAVPKVDEVKTSFDGEAPLDEVLEKTLKAAKLVHFVWHGIVVITDEKGRKAFQETDWTGLSEKGLKEHPELLKKMNTAFTFKWDAYSPREALKEFSKVTGVAINSDGLARYLAWREERGMIAPARTTLWGALVCLARTLGITYEISKAGGLIAKPPPKK